MRLCSCMSGRSRSVEGVMAMSEAGQAICGCTYTTHARTHTQICTGWLCMSSRRTAWDPPSTRRGRPADFHLPVLAEVQSTGQHAARPLWYFASPARCCSRLPTVRWLSTSNHRIAPSSPIPSSGAGASEGQKPPPPFQTRRMGSGGGDHAPASDWPRRTGEGV